MRLCTVFLAVSELLSTIGICLPFYRATIRSADSEEFHIVTYLSTCDECGKNAWPNNGTWLAGREKRSCDKALSRIGWVEADKVLSHAFVYGRCVICTVGFNIVASLILSYFTMSDSLRDKHRRVPKVIFALEFGLLIPALFLYWLGIETFDGTLRSKKLILYTSRSGMNGLVTSPGFYVMCVAVMFKGLSSIMHHYANSNWVTKNIESKQSYRSCEEDADNSPQGGQSLCLGNVYPVLLRSNDGSCLCKGETRAVRSMC